MTILDIESTKERQIGAGESIRYTAYFGPTLRDNDTIASVSSVAQTSGSGSLTVGAGVVNSGGAVSVDGRSLPINTVVQFRVTVPSGVVSGSYVVTVVVVTTGGDTLLMKCRLKVVS
jgi:hypothetical protein